MDYLRSQNVDYIEELFQRYSEDPGSVDESWRYFFDGIRVWSEGNGHATTGNGHAEALITPFAGRDANGHVNAEAKVGELIQTYRELGLVLARVNPLEDPPASSALLELANFELTSADLDRSFTAAKLIGLPRAATLREILAALRATYCGTIGVEYTHIQDKASREWLQEQLEASRSRADLSRETKLRVLAKLTEAECFERFLHTRYVAQKRFSIEGGDALIPMLDCLIDVAAETGAGDVVLGMAHRGRLNVLTNIFGKKYEYIFSEFEGTVNSAALPGEGDVKYHMGYSAEYETAHGKRIHLSLASNPSHLEFVNPVVEGVARAKQRLKAAPFGDLKTERKQVVPVVIHGDAAFAGQGVVYETIQLSLLRGYGTGGTVHIVSNNQVGFTTVPGDGRSTTYATDLAKMLGTPIFHVNGDDAEAVYYVTRLATLYRQTFHRDVVIDLVCYRKYGHNEGDEPAFTLPLMYKKIKSHPSPREIYVARLVGEGALKQEEPDAMIAAMNERLTAAQAVARASKEPPHISVFEGAWKGLRRAAEGDLAAVVRTEVGESVLKEIGRKLGEVPSGFTPHPKLVEQLKQRVQRVESGEAIDWGTGEALAFGSLVMEGTHVRLSGQDSERGTFSHRHSVLYDFENGARYVPLNNIREGQAEYAVYNSPLSEAAVLGFEYGHAMADPRALTIWEAQFGDFANGAQVIIDQFLASSESKWQRMCGLVLLLPHAYEGQGPEHSSARLERFLQLCGRENLQVANLTTPANLFHALRRQVVREFRKPLIVMSPKSLLRHPKAVSRLSEFSKAGFQEAIDDPNPPTGARRVILCSGKVYYDLAAERDARKIGDVAILRVEQLYPWPSHKVEPLLRKYAAASEVVWVQEEARNMGAWNCVRDALSGSLSTLGKGQKLVYIGRGEAAAPAVGSSKVHEKEQRSIVEEALK